MTPASAAVVANSRIKVLAFIYAWVFGSLVLGRLLLLVSEQRPKNHFGLIGSCSKAGGGIFRGEGGGT